MKMCRYVDVQMCRCANVQMCKCADVQMCKYADEFRFWKIYFSCIII